MLPGHFSSARKWMSSRTMIQASPSGIKPKTAVLHQRDAAGFEIGRINRVVDVLVGIEVGETHIIREPVGKILQQRRLR